MPMKHEQWWRMSLEGREGQELECLLLPFFSAAGWMNTPGVTWEAMFWK